jgi:hypothetical protein
MDVAIATLSGMTLIVQCTSVGTKAGQPGFPDLPYKQFPEIPWPIMPAGDVSNNKARILLMLNMVTPDDLVHPDMFFPNHFDNDDNDNDTPFNNSAFDNTAFDNSNSDYKPML